MSALDEGGAPATHGSRVVQTPQGGALDPGGPPTTLSERGTDRLAFLQGSVTRDATYLLNGTPIGPRDVLQARTFCFYWGLWYLLLHGACIGGRMPAAGLQSAAAIHPGLGCACCQAAAPCSGVASLPHAC